MELQSTIGNSESVFNFRWVCYTTLPISRLTAVLIFASLATRSRRRTTEISGGSAAVGDSAYENHYTELQLSAMSSGGTAVDHDLLNRELKLL